MSIYEYDEEYVKRVEREEGIEEGYSKGYHSGLELGEARKLVQIIDAALPNFESDLEQTCKMLNVTVAEYEAAKLLISDTQK